MCYLGIIIIENIVFYLPCNMNELLDKSPARAELKSLFRELFAIKRQVSDLLQECLSLLES